MGQLVDTSTLKELFVQSLVAPRAAGARIIALQLPPQALWIALALVSILLTAVFTAIMYSLPLNEAQFAELRQLMPAFESPLVVAIQNWGQTVISILLYHWIGRILGGRGQLNDMLAVMIWLQTLVLVLVVAIAVFALILPIVAGLLVIFGLFWLIWATVAFIDAAHRFDNIFTAIGVLIIAMIALMVGPLILLSLAGYGA